MSHDDAKAHQKNLKSLKPFTSILLIYNIVANPMRALAPVASAHDVVFCHANDVSCSFYARSGRMFRL
jgi:hypothetical protein